MPYTLKEPILLDRYKEIRSAMSTEAKVRIEAIVTAMLSAPVWLQSGLYSSIIAKIKMYFPNADKQAQEVLFFVILMAIHEKLETSSDSSRNADLDNCLQREQQSQQALSNVAKMLRDTALAVVRNVR